MGPGYRFADELPKPGRYELGSLAMANAGPDTNGSQFFIISGPQGVALPPKYALFGKVVSGLDVVAAIEARRHAVGKAVRARRHRVGHDHRVGLTAASTSARAAQRHGAARRSVPVDPGR